MRTLSRMTPRVINFESDKVIDTMEIDDALVDRIPKVGVEDKELAPQHISKFKVGLILN